MQEKQSLDQPDHPDTLSSMANLASTHRSQGKWDNAHSLLLDVANKMQHVILKEKQSICNTKKWCQLVCHAHFLQSSAQYLSLLFRPHYPQC